VTEGANKKIICRHPCGRRSGLRAAAQASLLFVCLALLIFLACGGRSVLSASDAQNIGQNRSQTTAPIIPVTVQQVVERPADLFTQGLVFYRQHLYESTGLYKKSAVHVYPVSELHIPEGLGTQAILQLPDEIFAEGLALANGELYLLSWQEGIVFVIDPADLTVKQNIFQPGEGWGLAYDGRYLWRSDGSDRLQRYLPGKFEPNGAPLLVKDGTTPLRQLNELEYDSKNNLMLANIWHSDLVAAISLEDGQVKYYLDLGEIAQREMAELGREAVANGLAIDGEGNLWATGKLWPRIYRLSY
jgi:glutamine cyclotransferase